MVDMNKKMFDKVINQGPLCWHFTNLNNRIVGISVFILSNRYQNCFLFGLVGRKQLNHC